MNYFFRVLLASRRFQNLTSGNLVISPVKFLPSSFLFSLSSIFFSGFLFSVNSFAQKAPTPGVEKIISEQKVATFVKGAAIYNQVCASCHATNNIMVASPKFGGRADWEARLKENKSLKGLVKSAINGKGPMPKKGLCPNCTPAELEAAIVYMMRGEE